MSTKTKTINKVVILGASFNTGNLGVSALGVSAIELLLNNNDMTQANVLGNVLEKCNYRYSSNSREVNITCYPVRFSPNIFNRNHFIWIYLAVSATKVLPFMKPLFSILDGSTKLIIESNMFLDITAGDSFSDIYGMKRMKRLYFEKLLCQMTCKPYIMLPQTYGPFKTEKAKSMANKVLSKASKIFSRDKEGLKAITQIIGENQKCYLCPDVAFTLVPEKCPLPAKMADHRKDIGLNISGLLFNGGYTGKNDFGLTCEYKNMVLELIEYFVKEQDQKIVLVPHVVPDNFPSENDLEACRKLKSALPKEISEKVIVAEPDSGSFYDQNQIKYIIGQCGFFLGSRMHSTIAAISQCVPTAGLAYSKKFAGVYETAGVGDCVIDLRKLDNSQIMSEVKRLYESRESIRNTLENNIPEVKKQVYSIFDDLEI